VISKVGKGHFFWAYAYREASLWKPVERNFGEEKLLETILPLLLGFLNLGMFVVQSLQHP
jgi:hypothetical protein